LFWLFHLFFYTIHMKNIVLVWAWWAGVSSLWWLLLSLWYTTIIACDKVDSDNLQSLKQQWAKIQIGHGNFSVQQWDIVIYSAATTHSPEVQQAFQFHEQNYKKSPPPMLFHQCMGEISKYFRTIAATGTHGKSSTSSMMAYALKELSDDFWVAVIGAQLSDWDGRSFALNTNHQTTIRSIFDHIFFRKGQPIGEIMKTLRFVVEADEYNKHFLFLDPEYSIIINCELDHLDTYGTQENYLHTFYQFMQKVRYQTIVPAKDETIQQLVEYNKTQPATIKEPFYVEQKRYNFSHIIGGHNHSNASLVEACLTTILPESHPKNIIESFWWILRRWELLWTSQSSIPVYSDYGHHPTELASTISALRDQFPDQHIHVLFQPHQMARIVQFREQFHEAMKPLNGEKRAYNPIYAARESISGCQEIFSLDWDLWQTQWVQQLHTVSSSQELSVQFAQQSNAPLLETKEAIYERIESISDGIIIYFSAGDLDKIIRSYIKK